MAAFVITVENTFDPNRDPRDITIKQRSTTEIDVLYPKGSGQVYSKDYPLEGDDSLTITIDESTPGYGNCSIWLPSTADARFVSEGKVDFIIEHEGARQKLKMSPNQPKWELKVWPPQVNSAYTDPPPDNVTVGDEGPGQYLTNQ